MRILLTTAAVLSLAVLIGACGGGEAPKAAKAEKPSTTGRLMGSTDPDGPKGPAPARANEVGASSSVPVNRAVHDKAVAPCSLVSRAQAQKIVGRPVMKLVEAPQGPTCLYRYDGGKSMVTLAIQERDAKTLTRDLPRKTTVEIADRKGFCARQGQEALYLPLSGNQVLSIAAGCDVAQDFASAALEQLS